MGWAVYTLKEIAERRLLGQSYSTKWIAELVKQAFTPHVAKAVLSQGGLDQAQLNQLKSHHKDRLKR